MLPTKRQRFSQDLQDAVRGKLLSLKQSLLSDGFPESDVDERLKAVVPLYEKWYFPVHTDELEERLKTNQGLCGTSSVKQAFQEMEQDALEVRKLPQIFNGYSRETDIVIKSLTQGILQVIWYTRMNLFSFLRIATLSCLDTPSFDAENTRDRRDGIYWYDGPSQEQQTTVDKKEKLISYLLFHFQLSGYRKVESDLDYVYTQKSVTCENGAVHNTYTWERKCSLRTAILELCRKEEQSELWSVVLSEKEVINAESYLKVCIDHEFPIVQYQRRKYSFRDGVYDGDTDKFVLYSDGVTSVFPELEVYGTFMFIDANFMSAHDTPLEDLSCPAFESIMTMQRWSVACIEMMYVMIGRSMHRVGERDNWQVLPYLIGEAGTGKSTIIDTVQKLIPRQLVGVFGSGGEAQFGTQDWDKLALIVFPELKPTEFIKAMPLGKLFSLIAGDSVCLAAKFKAPKYIPKFPVHIVAAGNERPSWGDANGAFTRRTVCFPFRVKLKQRNPDLPKLIDKELPAILRKSLCCYYKAVTNFAGKDLWSVGADGKNLMPQEVVDESRQMQKATNPLLDFLLDKEYVELDPKSSVTREEFIKAFDAFIRNVRHGFPLRWSDELYAHVFQVVNVHVETSDDGEVIKGVLLKKSF